MGGAEVQIHSFLTSTQDGEECSTSRPGRFISRKEPRYRLNRKVGRPQRCFGCFWRKICCLYEDSILGPSPSFAVVYYRLAKYFQSISRACGPGSSVGIATGYGLGGPGIESRWGEIFRTCPDRPWGPPILLYNGYRVFPGGKARPGRDADPSPPASAVVKKG